MFSTSSIQSKWRGPKSSSRQCRNPIIQGRINQVTKHIEVPQFLNKILEMPVVVQRQVSVVQNAMEAAQVQVVEKTVEGPQLQMVEKTAKTPETQTRALKPLRFWALRLSVK